MNNNKRLTGKVAVITGAGRGIGRAEALSLAAEGARIVVNDLGASIAGEGSSSTPAEEVVKEIINIGGEAVANFDSVATLAGSESIIKSAIDSFGRIDILVNNAGIVRARVIYNMSEEEWDTVLKTHLYGHFYCTRSACTYFRQQRSGTIINTSSIVGLGRMGQVNYSAAKEGIIGFTRSVARDMGKYGVTCNAIRPWAGTRMLLTNEQKAAWEKEGFQENIRMAEACTTEMVAAFVVFLCTDAALNVNGYDFYVGGGKIGVYTQPELKQVIGEPGKQWTVDDLVDILPGKLTGNLVNPAPGDLINS